MAAAFLLDRRRNLRHDLLDLARVFRMRAFKRKADGFRGGAQQLEKVMSRDLRPRTDGTRELVVVLGTLDEPDIAGFRELGARVLRHAQRHVAAAALDQHVGHRFGERLRAA